MATNLQNCIIYLKRSIGGIQNDDSDGFRSIVGHLSTFILLIEIRLITIKHYLHYDMTKIWISDPVYKRKETEVLKVPLFGGFDTYSLV